MIRKGMRKALIPARFRIIITERNGNIRNISINQ